MNVLADELQQLFPELSAMQFYRNIFPAGELDELDAMTNGKYTAIALEIPAGKKQVKRYTVTDELETIQQLQKSDDFCVIAPVSYAGKSRVSSNARFMYALVVELDYLIVKDGKQDGLQRLMTQWTERVHLIPQPTYIVASGNGLHLYYQFEQPLPMFKNIVDSMKVYKNRLTELIWNRHVTIASDKEKIQYESIFQAFRMVGTKTKNGDVTRAFVTGEKVNVEYMNRFVEPKARISEEYKSKAKLDEARELWPEWYEKRIVQGKPKGRWVCKEDLYNWWLRKIGEGAEAVVGHRYYCMMCLVIYAIKCDIPRERLEQDCFMLLDLFEERTDNEDNHFTEKDVLDALQCYDDAALVTYPLASIQNCSGIQIERNKRNGRKQADHAKYMRAIKKFKVEMGETSGGAGGRPSKRDDVLSYMIAHPDARKCDVIRETGLGRTTVNKYYDDCKAEAEIYNGYKGGGNNAND